MTASSSSPSLDGLAPILGRWQSSGTVFDDAGNIDTHITGTDEYRLLPGGFWIAHDVDVVMNESRTVAHELIGGSHSDGGLSMYAFDSATRPGVMRLSLHQPDLLLLEGEGVRSWFHFRAGPNHMTTQWERHVDGQWHRWMVMQFDRVDSSVSLDRPPI